MIPAGRLLLALYFLLPGIMKFTSWGPSLDYMQFHNIPFPEAGLLVAGLSNIIGAVLLASNRYVRLTAIGFVAYTLIVNFNLHDFWTMEGDAAQREMQNFIKNLGIVAGLLVLAGASPKRSLWPLDLLRSDAAQKSA